MQRFYSFFWIKIKLKIIKWPSRKWNMAITKTENAIFEDDFIILLEFLYIFLKKSKKILQNRDLCKKIWNLHFRRIFLLFLFDYFGEMGKNGCYFIGKNTDKLSKDPRKMRNEFLLVRKQELDFLRIFLLFFGFFSWLCSFYLWISTTFFYYKFLPA